MGLGGSHDPISQNSILINHPGYKEETPTASYLISKVKIFVKHTTLESHLRDSWKTSSEKIILFCNLTSYKGKAQSYFYKRQQIEILSNIKFTMFTRIFQLHWGIIHLSKCNYLNCTMIWYMYTCIQILIMQYHNINYSHYVLHQFLRPYSSY